MAGTLVIPNQFQSQSGPIPLSQLDANFTAVANSINAVTTLNAYVLDTSGSPNTIIGAIASPSVFSYTAGSQLTVKMANTNTGATTININSLGSVNVLTSSLTALPSGALVANGTYVLTYDGTQFQLQSQPTSVTSAQITAALGYTAGC